ncbi:hypothetical protein Bca52824_019074 [Brassica carinata]|uniref:Uncharacterized protein n=1 Tax=Brassica carinata TaxID=52824 RepID=A0A8X8AZ67_BRACI|nr:hypothetical protein Bca52824_019074 [Brassica carinata]
MDFAAGEECDLFTGNWVFDNETHPLYKEEHCEFLTEQIRSESVAREAEEQEIDSVIPPGRKGLNQTGFVDFENRQGSFDEGDAESLDWENPDGIKCALETTPIPSTSMVFNAETKNRMFSKMGTDYRLFSAVENVTQSTKVPIRFLNITGLSEYRKDAHTSVYTTRQGKLLTREQQTDPAKFKWQVYAIECFVN